VNGADKKGHLPAFLMCRFLSAIQREQLVTIHRNFQAAWNFLLFSSAHAHCKAKKLKALCNLSIKSLKVILADNGLLGEIPPKERNNGQVVYERIEKPANEYRDINEVLALDIVSSIGVGMLCEKATALITSTQLPFNFRCKRSPGLVDLERSLRRATL